MNCAELNHMQQNFAALLSASSRQEDVTRHAAEKGQDITEHLTVQQWIEKQKELVATALSSHVKQHGCAN
jgi:hypothetical protein